MTSKILYETILSIFVYKNLLPRFLPVFHLGFLLAMPASVCVCVCRLMYSLKLLNPQNVFLSLIRSEPFLPFHILLISDWELERDRRHTLTTVCP